MKTFNRIVLSDIEPSKHSLWIKNGNLQYFGKSGWTGLDTSGNIELKNILNQEIKDRKDADQEIKDTYLPLSGGTMKLSAILKFKGVVSETEIDDASFTAQSEQSYATLTGESLMIDDNTSDNIAWYGSTGIQLHGKTVNDILTAKNSTVKISTINGNPIMTDKDQDFTLAPLENGLIPAAYLPSYVDDVLEYGSVDVFPETGESGKIYVDTTTNLTYRWSGTQYVEVGKSIGLGTSAADAYPGNLGQQNADNIASLQEAIGGLGDTYATKTELGNYLPLTGGTLIGNLIINENLEGLNNEYAYIGISRLKNGVWNCGLINNPEADSSKLYRGFNCSVGESFVNLGYLGGSSGNPTLTLKSSSTKLLQITTDGITIQNKAASDLLNAAGGTTSISDIVEEIPSATSTTAGAMTAADKNKLDAFGVSGIQTVAELPESPQDNVLYIVVSE